MRIALLTNFIPPYRVGLFEEIARRAGELRVLVSTHMESNRQWTPDWGSLDVVVQRKLTLQRVWKTRSFHEDYELHIPYDTIAQLKRYRPDVILTGEMGARSIQAVAYARMRKTPVVLWAMLSEHTESERGSLRRFVRSNLVRQVNAIIVNGESGARYFQRMGVPDSKLVRVNQSLDMSAFMQIPVDRPVQTPRRILHVGTVSERKGVQILLDALARVRAPYELTLVGDGPLRTELSRRTPANVHWIGNVPYEQLPQFYAQADVLVFPSLGDEWGLVVNEALAAGVPVLGSSYAQSVEELIHDGVNGWSFTPNTADRTAVALERALQTPNEQLQRMRLAARESVQHLTPEAAAERIVETLRSVA